MAQEGKEGGNDVEKPGVSDQADGAPRGSTKLRVVSPVTGNHSLSCPRQGAALQDRGKENLPFFQNFLTIGCTFKMVATPAAKTS